MWKISINSCQCIYNLLQYSQNYSITLGSFWNYYRDEIDDAHNNASNIKQKLEYKTKIVEKTPQIPAQTDPDEGSRPTTTITSTSFKS